MSTACAVETNIASLPASDQARTTITHDGKLTTIKVDGKDPLKGLIVKVDKECPDIKLDGSFKRLTLVGAFSGQEKFITKGGGTVIKSLFDLGEGGEKSRIKFSKNYTAKRLKIANFTDKSKLKYQGHTYTSADITGNKFDGISGKEIKLV